MPQAISTRWCPTPEQLMILEDMYRGGIRTPNASQIQQITSHLSFYGKIEGKNVFYWFQNHKARERQKLRRKMGKHFQYHPHLQDRAATSFHVQQNQHFFRNQETSRVMNFLCKLETPDCEEVRKPVIGGGGNQEWVMLEINPASCYRPLQTLELFPITSTGLKEEKTKSSVTSTTASTACSCSKTAD